MTSTFLYFTLLPVLLSFSSMFPEFAEPRMMGMGGGGSSSAGVMQLLAVGLIAKLLQDMKNAKMGQQLHTTKIIPLPVYLGNQGMMGNDWMMQHGMMGGMMD
ncbi:hypothetical protein HNY73_020149 [Argiope bruennichi]|uniref:Uncharacterized protein n=1 Tax=Argiope bruennichi TaxID=94029 RepID=A0A8T0E720_ARGBR|nr:hypothetical protein HNY73_020149 [Argiope bruennichi]